MKQKLQNKRGINFLRLLTIMCLISLHNNQINAQLFIEAEDYVDMQDVQTEGCSDLGGGTNVGWIDNNDWMEYEINIPVAGDYVLDVRAASLSGGGVITISSEASSLGSFSVPATGDWQAWQTVAGDTIQFEEGVQKIKLTATTGGFNLNWFELRLSTDADSDHPTDPVIIDSATDVHSISLVWNSCVDTTSLVTGYKVFNNGQFFAFSTDTNFVLEKLAPEKEFNLTIYACDLAGNLSSEAAITIATEASNWELAWSDEFDGTEVDLSKWAYETGGDGWGNGEAQYYTDGANSSVADGNLIIEARQETIGSNKYTSSRMHNTEVGDFLYGRVEVRAKLPSTGGTWPAIWTLPTDWVYGNWPECGEIDIMEHRGNYLNYVFGTIHTGAYNHVAGTAKSGGVMFDDVVNEFHTYTLEWYPDHLDWYYDDEIVFTFNNEYKTFAEWPYDIKHHLMLNVAIGGGLGGEINDAGVWPQQMLVDFVRVYNFDFSEGDTAAPSTPSNLQAEASGINVQLSWNLSIDDKYVEKYYVFIDDELFDSVSGGSCLVKSLQPLTEYTFSVMAKDFAGNYSDKVYVNATTLDIESFPVPGTFEAEDYLYMSGIQTQDCSDAGGGLNVAYINPDDWLEYSIDVEAAGKYFLATRVAAQSLTGSFDLLDESKNVLTAVETPATGAWQKWTTVVSDGFRLEEGVQRISIYSKALDYNLNWFGITADSTEYASSVGVNPASNFTIYPNPLKGNILTIELNNQLSDFDIRIYTIHGKEVFSEYYSNVQTRITIDNLNLPAGIYQLTIRGAGKSSNYKLLKD